MSTEINSITLTPVVDFETSRDILRLSRSLNSKSKKPMVASYLRSRHMLEVMQKYGSTITASETAIVEARQLHIAGVLGTYAINYDSEYVGLATVDPNPTLERLKLSLPPRFARGPLRTNVTPHGPKVKAWVAPTYQDNDAFKLISVYRALRDPKGVAQDQFERFGSIHEDTPSLHAWTIEPSDAYQWVRSAIRHAGYVSDKADVGNYHDGGSDMITPPISRLYIAPTTAA